MLFCISVEPLFDHEKLDVYCLELQFVAWIADFFDDVSRCSVQRRRELRNPRSRRKPAFLAIVPIIVLVLELVLVLEFSSAGWFYRLHFAQISNYQTAFGPPCEA